jgi:hypothetical protein
MRIATAVLVISAALGAPMGAGALTAGADLGVSPQLGLAYAGAWDPGYSGTAIEAAGFLVSGILQGEAGVEAGGSPIGWQVLFPLRGGIRLSGPPFTFEILGEAAPGMALFRPAPLFMIGAGAVARAVWQIIPALGLYAGMGARFTLCPAYQGYTGRPYASLDLPASIGVRWTITAGQ